MKIVFMGTPDFAVPCLKVLAESSHEVSAVFTQPDKPKGRGYKMIPTPVKSVALEYGLPVYQPRRCTAGYGDSEKYFPRFDCRYGLRTDSPERNS